MQITLRIGGRVVSVDERNRWAVLESDDPDGDDALLQLLRESGEASTERWAGFPPWTRFTTPAISAGAVVLETPFEHDPDVDY